MSGNANSFVHRSNFRSRAAQRQPRIAPRRHEQRCRKHDFRHLIQIVSHDRNLAGLRRSKSGLQSGTFPNDRSPSPLALPAANLSHSASGFLCAQLMSPFLFANITVQGDFLHTVHFHTFPLHLGLPPP